MGPGRNKVLQENSAESGPKGKKQESCIPLEERPGLTAQASAAEAGVTTPVASCQAQV